MRLGRYAMIAAVPVLQLYVYVEILVHIRYNYLIVLVDNRNRHC